MNEIEALTILLATPGLGPIKIKSLLKIFGSALETLHAKKEEIRICFGQTSSIFEKWDWWKTNYSWKKNIEIAYNQDVEIITHNAPNFPRTLLETIDHPLLLYVKGKIHADDEKGVAIVGTRSPSIYGKEMAEKLSSDLTGFGFSITSGLARGIDTAAHLGALKNGRTIAVIGSGLGNIYPKENKRLAAQIEENGAVISEFSMQTPPERHNFPRRNRIVSGMTSGTVLIEAPEKSGAMITMNLAFDQGKKLFALPGRADSQNFKGNHLLIKKGMASLVENAEDILAPFNSLVNIKDHCLSAKLQQAHLDIEEKELLQKLPQEELNIEEIVKITKLPVMKLNILLMSLVMKKIIKEYPGKIYKKG